MSKHRQGYTWAQISHMFPPTWSLTIAFRKTTEACKRLGLIQEPKNENRKAQQFKVH